jgi:hypothetical protein
VGSAAKAEAPTQLNNAATRAERTFQRGCTQEIQPESDSKGNLRMWLMIQIPPTAVGLGVFGETGVPFAGGMAIGEQDVGPTIVALLGRFAADG